MGNGSKEGDSTIILFTEFPEALRAKNLYLLFKEFGEIDVVVIPSKWDKWGRKYGFVHFFNIRDARNLILKLDNFIIEGMNLFINLPRFQRVAFAVFWKEKSKVKYVEVDGWR